MSPTVAEIIEKLKTFADQGVPYYQAKEELIKLGYKQTDITLASYSYAYGEKPPEVNLVKQALEKNPELAEKVAKGMADELQTTEDIKTFKDITQDNVVDKGSDVHQNSIIIRVGLSWWFWLSIGSILTGIMLWLQVPVVYYLIVVGIFGIIFTIRILVNKYKPTK